MRKKILYFLISLVFALFLVSCSISRYSEVATRSFDSSTIKTIKLQTQNGNINIKSWEGKEIKIDILKMVKGIGNLESEINKITVSFKENNGVLSCVIKMPRVSSFFMSYDADIIVRLPRRMFETIDLKTSNGNIEVENTIANFVIRTSNGKVDIYQSMGTFDLKTQNGKIYLNGVQIFEGENKIETSKGSIMGNLKLPNSGSLSLETRNGDVDLELSGYIKADFEAKTSNGEIVIKDLNLAVEKKDKRMLKGKINGGGLKLSISTSNGNIKVQGIPAIPV